MSQNVPPCTHTHITLLSSHPQRWTHTQNICSHDYKTAENIWHDDKCLLCCQSLLLSTCSDIFTCYREKYFKKWHPAHTLRKKDRQGTAMAVAMIATVAACKWKHAWQRQSWSEGSGKMSECTQKVKLKLERYRWSPLILGEALLPDSLGFSAVMRLASTSTGCAERHAGLNVHVWPPKATRRSPSAYTFNTFPIWPST